LTSGRDESFVFRPRPSDRSVVTVTDSQLLQSASHCAALVTGTTFRAFRTAAVGVKKSSWLSLLPYSRLQSFLRNPTNRE
jgi:hypothetical protein